MVLRPDADAVIAIGQPAHAWLSGQLARAWGNERFGAVEPWEEVCLGAEQHDTGMAAYDARPDLNPETGRPRAFTEMDVDTHLELWSGAAERVLPQSRYAALLVSLHGTALQARRAPTPAVRAFLAAQRALQDELLAALRADPRTAAAAAEDRVRRNQRLVWTWDSLSLGLLLDWWPYALEAVPAADGAVDVAVRAGGDGAIVLEPWPFSAPRVTVRCEGRRLAGRYGDEAAMHAALAASPWVTLEFALSAPTP
jgi:Protein of unknown function (DUF3891)